MSKKEVITTPLERINPEDLFQEALRLVQRDLKALAEGKDPRSAGTMQALNQYLRTLHAITTAEQVESLAVQRELSRLSPQELQDRLRLEAEKVDKQALRQAASDAIAIIGVK